MEKLKFDYTGLSEAMNATKDVLETIADWNQHLNKSLIQVHVWRYWRVSFVNARFDRSKFLGLDLDKRDDLDILLEEITQSFEGLLDDYPGDIGFYHTLLDDTLMFVVEFRPREFPPRISL